MGSAKKRGSIKAYMRKNAETSFEFVGGGGRCNEAAFSVFCVCVIVVIFFAFLVFHLYYGFHPSFQIPLINGTFLGLLHPCF